MQNQQLIEIQLNDPQMEIAESTAQRNLFHSGVGIGKSECIGVISFDFVLNNPEVRGFIGANTYSQLTKSTLDRVFNVWENKFKLVKNVHFVVDRIPPKSFKRFGSSLKTYENTICFNNGSVIFVASLDNYKVIDGTEFGWAMLDETKDTKEEAVKEVIVARLRQKGMYLSPKGIISKTMKPGYTGYNPLFIFTSPAKAKWIMKWFELDKYADEIEKTIYNKEDYFRKCVNDKMIVIASTFHNEHNLSPGYIDRLIADLAHNESLIKMLIYGSPFGKTGGEYYHAFSRVETVKTFDIWQEEPVHLTFDFNLVPYITCTCWQMKWVDILPRSKRPGYLVRCFDEFCLPNPKNNAESLSKEILAKYRYLLKNGLFYYGDWSGKTNNTVSESVRNNFEMIERILKEFITNYSNRTIVNAKHVKRRQFANNIFGGHPDIPIEIEIHERCVETISDYEHTKENPEGGKLKTKVTVNGRSYEEHGHTSDSGDYFLTSAFDSYFEKI